MLIGLRDGDSIRCRPHPSHSVSATLDIPGNGRTNIFPLPFQSIRILSGGNNRSYVIGAMFTAGYAEKAQRLAASCDRLGLRYVIHEVPSVHRSLSRLGTDDLSYTKPNFIRHLLSVHRKPVLYVDADCEFVDQPALIDQLVAAGYDFAIYNAYADEFTDRFLPIALSLRPGEPPIRNRFFKYSRRINWASDDQLGCFGCVQLYRNSLAARTLLSRWHQTIISFPGSGDDAHLNFTYNNLERRSWLYWLLKVHWLPQSYTRICWWIFTKPVINHPDIPGTSSEFIEINDPAGRRDVYRSSMGRRNALPFPRDCIIDAQRDMICRLVDGELISLGPTNETIWL